MCGDWAAGWACRRHPSSGRCRPCSTVCPWSGLMCMRRRRTPRSLRWRPGSFVACGCGWRRSRSWGSWRRCRARCGRSMRPGRPGSGWRALRVERGIDVRVVAAGKVPRASGDRVKTDKRDAERLARLLAAGELRFAFVPSVADEQFRDVIRAIEDCRGDLMRARHRLSKLLLRRDIRWAGPGSTWTQTHMRWLRSLRFEDLVLAGRVRRLPVRGRDARRPARRADRRARAGDPRQPPRLDDRRACAASAGSTRCRPPGCAPRSVTGSASGPSSCRGSWGSSRPSTPPTPSAARARSPRPDRSTPAGCWSRPPTTTATAPPSATAWLAASTARTRA